ncbi:hypothetical protein U8V72_14685 [Priestia filamentosa]|uniref:hypothetical protein n=1 Tax=Priestia filamentosa TaxID=1402861 RepID=UPI00397C9A74
MSIRRTLFLLGLGYGTFIFAIIQLLFKSLVISSLLGTIAGSVLFFTLALFAGGSQNSYEGE